MKWWAQNLSTSKNKNYDFSSENLFAFKNGSQFKINVWSLLKKRAGLKGTGS